MTYWSLCHILKHLHDEWSRNKARNIFEFERKHVWIEVIVCVCIRIPMYQAAKLYMV